MSAFTAVFKPIVAAVAAHFRVEIGEMEPGAGNADGNGVGCVEAEEPDAGFTAVSYVSADVKFGNAERVGNAGVARRRTPDMRKGTTPIQASFWNVSISNAARMSGRNFDGSIRQ
jgi:hypothetical protein